VNKKRDEQNDYAIRALAIGATYELGSGDLFHVIKIDDGRMYRVGRRPAQALVLFLSGEREGTRLWLTGSSASCVTRRIA
jgi:hypothetical protein